MAKQLRFEMGADSRFILQTMNKAAVGDVLTYASLGELIGKDVSGSTPALRTAIKACLRDEGTVFACVHKVGVKRLSDSEIVGLGESETGGTHRRVKRTARKLSVIADYSAMTPNDQIRHTALLSVNAIVADATREKTVSKIAKVAAGRSGELPIRETLKAMGFAE